MTTAEYEASAARGKVPAAVMDGLRPMAMDILMGRRVICCDVGPDRLVDHYGEWNFEIGPAEKLRKIRLEDSREVVAAVKDGRLRAMENEEDATYFLPGQEWRVLALEEACSEAEGSFNSCLIGMLLGYSDDDINAFHHRLEWTAEEVTEEWAAAWKWIRGIRC